MDTVIQTLQTGLPVLLIHSAVTFLLLLGAVTLYMKATPYREWALILEGNTAAAISLGGAMLGMAIPLAFCLQGSFSVTDILLWGATVLGLQIIAFIVLDQLCRGLKQHIENGNVAVAVFLASVKLCIAAVTSAAIAV